MLVVSCSWSGNEPKPSKNKTSSFLRVAAFVASDQDNRDNNKIYFILFIMARPYLGVSTISTFINGESRRGQFE